MWLNIAIQMNSEIGTTSMSFMDSFVVQHSNREEPRLRNGAPRILGGL